MRSDAEIFVFPLGILAVLIAVPTIAYVVISLFEGFPRLKLKQLLGMVAVAAWCFAPVALPPWDEAPFIFLTAVAILITFFAIWRREFRLLMLRRDDEFPGRWDKLGWFLILTLGAPAGVWFFRAFRKAQWPDSDLSSFDIRTKTLIQNPWDRDEAEELSPTRAGVE